MLREMVVAHAPSSSGRDHWLCRFRPFLSCLCGLTHDSGPHFYFPVTYLVMLFVEGSLMLVRSIQKNLNLYSFCFSLCDKLVLPCVGGRCFRLRLQ